MQLDVHAITNPGFQNVQFGRLVEVEIFKTDDNRGWGLRCKEDLYMGMIQAGTIDSNLDRS